MEALILPVFSSETTIPVAITGMKAFNRSGIVEANANAKKAWIIRAVDLLLAKKKGSRLLADIREKREVRELTAQQVATHQLEIVHPQATWQAYDNFFGKTDADFLRFGFAKSVTQVEQAGAVLGLTVIITRHETLRDELSSPSDCYCTGKHQHSFKRPPAKDGDKCPMGDHATVVCD